MAPSVPRQCSTPCPESSATTSDVASISTSPGSAVRTSASRTERLAQIGTLAASVAHEINNPAAFVLTNHGLIIEHLEELEQMLAKPTLNRAEALSSVHEMMEMCRDNRVGIQRIASISRELRNYARVDDSPNQAPHTTLRANDAVRTALTMVRNRVRQDATLQTRFGQLPPVVGDASKIAQVVMNLIVNAAQAMRSSDVAARGRAAEGRIEVSTVNRGTWVAIVVRDNGPGMPSEVQQRIFEPFFTTKILGEGTGLGLAICADIVREHGGRIDCHSVLGGGTTFEVLLPAVTSEPAPATPATPAKRAAREPSCHMQLGGRDDPAPQGSTDPGPPRVDPRAARILLVDDDVNVARSLKRALEPPHQVVVAHGGREALALLHTGSRFEVVICDVMMPDIDGVQLYREACAIEEDLGKRFIFITGGTFSPRTTEFLENTLSPVCRKPLALADLRLHVARTLAALRRTSAA